MDDLLKTFHEAEKPPRRWRIGTEVEKFGVRTADGKPIPFEGEHGVREVLQCLALRHGWYPEAEYEGGERISLRRGDSSITLEPGGQLELSGAPLETIHETCMEVRGHMAELEAISGEMGIAWLGLGFHPTARQEDLPWVPKLRYRIMREYLPQRGSMALDMMRRTATVQANLDYSDEEDALRKLRLALRLSPIVTAMFANSPWLESKVVGRSQRARVWLHMDPDRSGLLPFLWAKEHPGYRDYVEWALDVPMFMVKRGARVVENTGQTFRAFMSDGFEGAVATAADWESHLNTLFPEARLKKIIEVRGADGQKTGMVCSLPALWKGLLYESKSFDAAEALVATLGFDEAEAAREPIAAQGMAAPLGSRPVREWASELIEIAMAGLGRLAHLDPKGRDEQVHLAALEEMVHAGRSPADQLIEEVPEGPDFLCRVVAAARA